MGWLVGCRSPCRWCCSSGRAVHPLFRDLDRAGPRIEPDGVLVATIDPQRADLEPALRVALYERVRKQCFQTPDVAAAGISFLTPLGGGGFTPPVAVETPSGPCARRRTAMCSATDFLRLVPHLRTPVISGRDFTEGDRKGAPRVAIVNEAFVRLFLAGASPLGRTLTIFPNTSRALQSWSSAWRRMPLFIGPRSRAPDLVPAGCAVRCTGIYVRLSRLSVRTSGAAPAGSRSGDRGRAQRQSTSVADVPLAR